MSCPTEWSASSNFTCYRIYKGTGSSFTACEFNTMCAIDGARLATLYATSDVDLVQTLFPELFSMYYIGLTDIRQEAVFQWMDAQNVSSSISKYWNDDQPDDNKNEATKGADCGTLMNFMLSNVTYTKVFDVHCNISLQAAVCEKGLSQMLPADDVFKNSSCYVETTSMTTGKFSKPTRITWGTTTIYEGISGTSAKNVSSQLPTQDDVASINAITDSPTTSTSSTAAPTTTVTEPSTTSTSSTTIPSTTVTQQDTSTSSSTISSPTTTPVSTVLSSSTSSDSSSANSTWKPIMPSSGSVYKPSCRCGCTKSNKYSNQFILNMVERMKIGIKDTGRYKRKLVCAEDGRASSKAMGSVAIAVIVTLTSSIVLMDIRGPSSKPWQEKQKQKQSAGNKVSTISKDVDVT